MKGRKTIFCRFGIGEDPAGAWTTAGSIDAALPCSMLCWSAACVLIGTLMLLASAITVSCIIFVFLLQSNRWQNDCLSGAAYAICKNL